MIIFPAIDLKDGKCVRLYKGDFSQVTIFNDSPLKQIEIFKNEGFDHIHIVDLDAAKDEGKKNKLIIKEIIKNTRQKIQVGGGIRNIKAVEEWLNLGVSRVILGSLAIEDPKQLKIICKEFKDKIAIAVDMRKDSLSIRGWTKDIKINLGSFLDNLISLGVQRVIYTDIEKDGTKLGQDIEKVKKIFNKFELPFLISGGISEIKQIDEIIKINNCEGIIIGKAIYDNTLDLKKLRKYQN